MPRARTRTPAIVRCALLSVLALAVAIAVGSVAWARPGGGNSFGGGSGSSGGGDGGGEAIFFVVRFLIELTVEQPIIGIPVDIIAIGIGVVVVMRGKKKRQAGWSTSAAQQAIASPTRRAIRRELLAAVTARDPDFSLVLFEDFAYALFAAAHEARGRQRLETLAPWLREPVRLALRTGGAGLTDVRAIVIGAMRYVDVQTQPTGTSIDLEFEANYSEIGAHEQSYYVRERWSLGRAATARSRPPEKARSFECPNCGAPLSSLRGNVCTYCNRAVDTGEFDWVVHAIRVIERTPKAPQLTADADERGTGLPTVYDRTLQSALGRLGQRDPAFAWNALQSRLGLVFSELQVAWSTCDWSRARPYVSDQLFQMLAYWIETYKREKLRNVTERARITRMEPVALISDRYFDALTVRLFATGLDYVVTADGSRVVSGSRSRERDYSEYWTLVRAANARGPARCDRACPRCGAPLAVNMGGSCTHCKARVTTGDFDWVLSRIEQDEAYSG